MAEKKITRISSRVVVPARQATQPGGIGSLDSILGLLKSLKIRTQETGLVGGGELLVGY